MAAYTEDNVQYIFPYWDAPKWTTEPNKMMVKYIFGKGYSNGADVMKTLGGDKHGINGDLISTVLYEMVSITPFAAPTVPALPIPPTETHPQLASYERKHKEKLKVFLNLQHFREALINSFSPSHRPHTSMGYSNLSSISEVGHPTS